MCWSMKSSGCFALLGAVMTADQVRRMYAIPQKAHRGRMFSQVILYLSYTVMELLQFAQYYFGIEGTCGSTQNIVLSIVAHFLIWTQPIAHNYWCLKNTVKGRSTFRYALFCSIATLIFATISLLMGYYHVGGFGLGENVDSTKGDTLFGIEIQNVNPVLCSHQGPNHLYWMFPYHPMWGHGISWYVWLMVAAFPHFFRYSVKDNDFLGRGWLMGTAVIAGWLVALAVTLCIGVFHETPSYWCLISVPWLALPYVAAFFMPERFVVREDVFVKEKKEKKE